MKLAISIALTTMLIAGTAMLAAPGQDRTTDRPGQLTRSSVLVDNRARVRMTEPRVAAAR